ncbi:MAG: class I SAM-dependent methyltransferase [Rectinemataceae bacterium]
MATWQNDVDGRIRRHYERYPYPRYNILGSIRAQDSYVFNLEALWARFNAERIRAGKDGGILLAGCGSFLPYPVSVANPRGRIDALDLSTRALVRARLHALRHLRFNIRYLAGDLMDASIAPGPYCYIDSYGVLHCIPDFVGALGALADRLVEGGILRVMVYSRDARAEVERVRALCSKRGIATPREVKALAEEDGSVRECMRNSFEMSFDEGIADAFLIPYARTFVVDELLQALSETPLSLVRFCHQGALPDTRAELARIRKLEETHSFPTNISFYARKGSAVIGRPPPSAEGEWIELNPRLRGVVRLPSPGSSYLPPKFGPENPPLDARTRSFLRRFIRPLRSEFLSAEDRARARPFLDRLILISYSAVRLPQSRR